MWPSEIRTRRSISDRVEEWPPLLNRMTTGSRSNSTRPSASPSDTGRSLRRSVSIRSLTPPVCVHGHGGLVQGRAPYLALPPVATCSPGGANSTLLAPNSSRRHPIAGGCQPDTCGPWPTSGRREGWAPAAVWAPDGSFPRCGNGLAAGRNAMVGMLIDSFGTWRNARWRPVFHVEHENAGKVPECFTWNSPGGVR